MRAAIITTVRHNIGDDFVREGILYLLSVANLLDKFDFIHKHSPITAVYGLENVRSRALSMAIDPFARFIKADDRIKTADMVIQSGAPVYWCHPGRPHCGNSEWFGPLIRKRFVPDRRSRKFLNLAGGSCQRYHSDGSELDFCPKCSTFIREFFDACDLTILRDKLAKTMLNKVGRDAAVLPCTSIFARDRMGLVPKEGKFIVLNFMENGGHYTFGQSIDTDLWRGDFQRIAETVKKMGRVVVACHTAQEERLAKSVVPGFETFLIPNDHIEYMKFYAEAKFGIVNRVHAGFMMASLGKPVAVIGNDSRALMIENLNLASYFVSDVGGIGIEQIVDSVRTRIPDYADEIEVIRKQTKEQYISAISAAVSS